MAYAGSVESSETGKRNFHDREGIEVMPVSSCRPSCKITMTGHIENLDVHELLLEVSQQG